jgi:hypothetical protein
LTKAAAAPLTRQQQQIKQQQQQQTGSSLLRLQQMQHHHQQQQRLWRQNQLTLQLLCYYLHSLKMQLPTRSSSSNMGKHLRQQQQQHQQFTGYPLGQPPSCISSTADLPPLQVTMQQQQQQVTQRLLPLLLLLPWLHCL